jgi:hypothetical protein
VESGGKRRDPRARATDRDFEVRSRDLGEERFWAGYRDRRCAKQREVHRSHEEGPLVQSLRVRAIAAIGARTQ